MIGSFLNICKTKFGSYIESGVLMDWINSTLSSLSGFLSRKPPTTMMDPSSFAMLFSDREWDTQVFLKLYLSAVMASEHPMEAMDKFPLETIGLGKTEETEAQHEFVDLKAEGDRAQSHEFCLERVVSDQIIPDDKIVNTFLRHPDHEDLINAIKKAVVLTSPALVAGAAASVFVPSGTIPSGTKAIIIPLSISAAVLSASSLPHLFLFREESPLPRFFKVTPKYTFVDKVSMSVAQILQVMSDSQVGAYVSGSLKLQVPGTGTRAYDRFVGGDGIKRAEYQKGIRLATFKPKRLKLIHMAILADVVHEYYPIYALFLRQCYWFASLIFLAAQIIDQDLDGQKKLRDSDNTADLDNTADSDLFYLPYHLLSSDKAGCWKGIRINGCREVVLVYVVKTFHARLAVYMDQVFILFHLGLSLIS